MPLAQDQALTICNPFRSLHFRAKGQTAKVKLDEHELIIRDYVNKGISKRAIAKLVDCAPNTLYNRL